jgi:hypothetical protein
LIFSSAGFTDYRSSRQSADLMFGFLSGAAFSDIVEEVEDAC